MTLLDAVHAAQFLEGRAEASQQACPVFRGEGIGNLGVAGDDLGH